MRHPWLVVACALAPMVAHAEQPIDLRAEIAKAIAEARAESHAAIRPPAHGTPPSTSARAASPTKRAGKAKARPKEAPSDAEARDPEVVWTELMQGNLRFVEGRPRTREVVQLRRELARGQKPKAIVLACADSRVPPELLFDQSLGDLFVVRAAGNVADSITLGSIEYAVEHLGARLLVVLGHEECGAVAAASGSAKMPSRHLEALMGAIRPGITGLHVCGDTPPARRLRVEANAHHSRHDIVEKSEIVRSASERGQLAVFSAVYGLESGVVTWLPDPDLADAAPAAHPPPSAHAPAAASRAPSDATPPKPVAHRPAASAPHHVAATPPH